MIQGRDIAKWSWAESVNNETGKSCIILLVGAVAIGIGLITFAYGCFIKSSEIINPSIVVMTIGGALLTGNKIMQSPLDLKAIQQNGSSTTSEQQ